MVFHAFRPFRSVLSRLSVGQQMIFEHARWLSWAVRNDPPLPRIPVRRVSEGGFSKLMSTPSGRHRAERWWDQTLEQMGDEGE